MNLKKYKLTNKTMQTHDGFLWEMNKEYLNENNGYQLCTNQVFHYYDSPELASLFNPIHASIVEPRLFMVECDSVAHDGMKGGAKRMKLIKELPVVEFSKKQIVIFSVLVALNDYPKWRKYDKNQAWKQWADDYLNGKDISESASRSAESAAWSAESAASAAWSAESASRSAESAASAAWSAESAAWSAESAARSAESAASAASASRSAASASWSAASAASAEERSRLFQSIAIKVLSMNI